MRSVFPHRLDYRIAILDLFACVAGFEAASWGYQSWIYHPDPSLPSDVPTYWVLKGILSAVTAWAAVVFVEGRANDTIQLWMDYLFSAAGLNLIVQYSVAYLFDIVAISWLVIVAGSVLSAGIVFLLRKGLYRREEGGGILLMGFDAAADALTSVLKPRIAGVLENDPQRVSAGLPFLGNVRQLLEIVEKKRPGTIMVNDDNWQASVQPKELLALRYAGVAIESGTALYEKVLHRVCWERLEPADFLFASDVGRNRAALIFQAVYTNVIGLGLLLAMLPVLVVLVVLVTIFGGGGPALENIECLGFQQIPFWMLRFRTRRRNGSLSGIGKALTTLHLVYLPQLINVVRGEMALFGPSPVRKAFAEELCRLLPAFPYRFTVKPGILGWSQASLAGRTETPDESERLECDLYYVKQASPSFDFDIFLRTILRRSYRENAARPTAQ